MHDYWIADVSNCYLITPPLDLSAASYAHVRVNGGAWTQVWRDYVSVDYNPTPVVVDLSAYDGNPSVQVAFRYIGSNGHLWWCDEVMVSDSHGDTNAISGLVGGGLATFQVVSATPSGGVLVGYSLAGAGPTPTPYGLVDMSQPISQLPMMFADVGGLATMSLNVPPQASGFVLYTQAVDITSGTLTNSLAAPIL